MGAEAHEESSSTVTGMRVRAVRELSGMSRHDDARSTGLTRREIAAVERGSRTLDADEARALARTQRGARRVRRCGHTQHDDRDRHATLIDDVIGHDPDSWHDLPATAADLPKPLPFDLPESERRTDLDTPRTDRQLLVDGATRHGRRARCVREGVERGSGDDMHALLKELETRGPAVEAQLVPTPLQPSQRRARQSAQRAPTPTATSRHTASLALPPVCAGTAAPLRQGSYQFVLRLVEHDRIGAGSSSEVTSPKPSSAISELNVAPFASSSARRLDVVAHHRDLVVAESYTFPSHSECVGCTPISLGRCRRSASPARRRCLPRTATRARHAGTQRGLPVGRRSRSRCEST